MCNVARGVVNEGTGKLYLDDLLVNLDFLLRKALRKDRLSYMFHGSEEQHSRLGAAVTSLNGRLQAAYPNFRTPFTNTVFDNEFVSLSRRELVMLPCNVSYVAQSFAAVNYLHEDSSRLEVFGELTSASTQL